jgi:hypothetical protein
MEPFYVTLPSNADSEGTISHYTTVLPYTLELHGKWEVALSEMYLPHSWYNVDSTNNLFEYYEGQSEKGLPSPTPPATHVSTNNASNYNSEPTSESLFSPKANQMRASENVHVKTYTHVGNQSRKMTQAVLPIGYYKTTVELLDAIHKSMTELGRENIKLKKNFDGTVTLKTLRNAYICFMPGLAQMLGFDEWDLMGTLVGKYPADVKNGLYSAMIYTDIILPQIVGNVQAQILRVVPIVGKPNDLMVYRFPNPDYVAVARTTINTIEICIRTDHGANLVFNSGKSMCKLHFKPVH